MVVKMVDSASTPKLTQHSTPLLFLALPFELIGEDFESDKFSEDFACDKCSPS
jgi:hypothetical protein